MAKGKKKERSGGAAPDPPPSGGGEAEEEECEEQRIAREKLEVMQKEWESFRALQARGMAPQDDHPEQAVITSALKRELAFLAHEAARPASKRLPKNAIPPGDVLRAAIALEILESPDDARPAARPESTQVMLTRFIWKDTGRMVLGFNVNNVPTAFIPWRTEFGSKWTPAEWAWLIALVLRRLDLPTGVHSVFAQFKLQDCPEDDFRHRLREAFVDVCRTERLRDHVSGFAGANFSEFDEVETDRRNDLAFYFDTQLWRAARDLGFHVDDRSRKPAFTYFIGEDDCAVDHTRKRWKTVEAYVRHRLSNAPRAETLSDEEAQRQMDYLWALLKTQTLDLSKGTSAMPMANAYEAYDRFREKTLSKQLRKVASEFGQAVPAEVAKLSNRRCTVCGKAEGEFSDERTGMPGGKLRSCACAPGKPPFYCSRPCQKAHWKAEHKAVCPNVTGAA